MATGWDWLGLTGTGWDWPHARCFAGFGAAVQPMAAWPLDEGSGDACKTQPISLGAPDPGRPLCAATSRGHGGEAGWALASGTVSWLGVPSHWQRLHRVAMEL